MNTIIDMEELLRFCRNNKEMAAKIIQAYVSTIPLYIQEAQDAATSNDPQIIRAMCHKLSGAARSVRAPQVTASIEQLRELVIDHKFNEIPTALSSVCNNLNAVVEYAEQNISKT